MSQRQTAMFQEPKKIGPQKETKKRRIETKINNKRLLEILENMYKIVQSKERKKERKKTSDKDRKIK